MNLELLYSCIEDMAGMELVQSVHRQLTGRRC